MFSKNRDEYQRVVAYTSLGNDIGRPLKHLSMCRTESSYIQTELVVLEVAKHDEDMAENKDFFQNTSSREDVTQWMR